MIVGSLAILFNLLSVLALSGVLVVTAVCLIVRFRIIDLNSYSALARRKFLWLLAFSPWVIGTVAGIIALLTGSRYLPIAENYSFFHWHHPQEFLFNSWHGLSVAIAVSSVLFIVIRNIIRLHKKRIKLKTLLSMAESNADDFYYLDADTPAAFTAGYFQPKCYITKALLSKLSKEEYSIIKLHEKEHARRYDPYKKWVYQLLTTFFPKKISLILNQSLTTVMEQCADEAVALVIHDKSVIATTLLKVRRLAYPLFAKNMEHNLICHYGMDNIEERISYLLADNKGRVFPLFITILTCAVMSILCAMSADMFHHTIEYTLSHS